LIRNPSDADALVKALPAASFKLLSESIGRRLEAESPIDARSLAMEADSDRDGSIDAEEFALWWRRRGPTLLTQMSGHGSGPPSWAQLGKLGLLSALPCFVFGFLDNSIMLVAGDAIESSLGAKLGLSGLACAALGNVVADTTGSLLLPACLPACLLPACVRALRPHERVHATTSARPRSSIGQLSGSTVDTVLRPVLPNPRLSPAQQQMRAARLTTAGAGAVGIIIGCLVGCFPLLFIEGDDAEGKPEAA